MLQSKLTIQNLRFTSVINGTAPDMAVSMVNHLTMCSENPIEINAEQSLFTPHIDHVTESAFLC